MAGARTDLPHGVTLSKSSLGGFQVEWNGEPIGWIHENGEEWNAYKSGTAPYNGEKLGRWPQAMAVQKIAFAAGWPAKRQAPER
jgi:hypothetical protein